MQAALRTHTHTHPTTHTRHVQLTYCTQYRLPDLKRELPLYLSAASNAPALDTVSKSAVDTYTDSLLKRWRVKGIPNMGLGGACCLRYFTQLRIMSSGAVMLGIPMFGNVGTFRKYFRK